MKTETKEIYKCDHCNKLYQIKRFCIDHEPKCRKNPDNKRKCLEDCEYLVKKHVTYFWDAYDGSHESSKEILYCDSKKEGVYPFWITGLLSEDIEGEIPNNEMPKECSHYKKMS